MIQGNWKLEQSRDDTFCIFNTYQKEYLYAAEYAPYDKKRRRVFTWIPGDRVSQGHWRIIKKN